LSHAKIERVNSEVSDAAIERTIDILRKQKCTFSTRPADEATLQGDQVTIDFEGKLDGVPFEGGSATDFVFVVGEGQMLEAFEKALPGMKVGESKTFPLTFPQDYQSKDVAGKEADFLVTVKKIEQQHLPEVNDAFAKLLGVQEGTIQALRTDIASNLEREVKFRVLARNKSAALDALSSVTQLDVPTALVQREAKQLALNMRNDLKNRGLKDSDKVDLPEFLFQEPATKRVRLGLVVADLVRLHNLQAKPDQLLAHIKEMAQSYEKPAEVIQWYLSDRQRMSEIEGVVVENNVTEFVLSKAQVLEKMLPFDELMAK
jgi:trigger factor